MIGDAWETDITGARAAGIRPIWFNRFGAASPDRSVTEIRLVRAVVFGAVRALPEPRIPSPESRPR